MGKHGLAGYGGLRRRDKVAPVWVIGGGLWPALRKRSHVREEPVTESPAKKTRALNSIPAPKPITIRDPASRSTAAWSIDEPPRQPFSGVQSAVGTSDMAGGLQSLDCGRGASQAGRRDRTRQGPYHRLTGSRRTGSRLQGSGEQRMLLDTPSNHEDQEVNDTDVGTLDNILVPPPTLDAPSGYMRPSQSAGTSSGLNMDLFVRPEEWIETSPVVLIPKKLKYFEVPPGNPDEPWDPKIDLLFAVNLFLLMIDVLAGVWVGGL
ncbi:hypothetical protein SOVF_179530 [Spinacia oleracea]|nr:hypothetical protein SOVF_179530 [Spinacia oleracea]